MHPQPLVTWIYEPRREGSEPCRGLRQTGGPSSSLATGDAVMTSLQPGAPFKMVWRYRGRLLLLGIWLLDRLLRFEKPAPRQPIAGCAVAANAIKRDLYGQPSQ